MGIIEDIDYMRRQGSTDVDISQGLKQKGYSDKEISGALSQSKIKEAVHAEPVAEQTQEYSEMSPSLMSSEASAGETVRIPVYLDGCKEILGYQFTASLDPSMFTLEGVQAANMPVGDENIGVFEDKPGVFTMSWHSIQPVTLTADEPAFYLIVTAKEDVRVHQWIDINNHITEAMAFDKSYRIMNSMR